MLYCYIKNNYNKFAAKSIFVKMIYDGVLVPFPSVIGPTYSFVAPLLVSVLAHGYVVLDCTLVS